jgi:2,4-dienoyl-CoA reductase (NADPH2)
MGGDLEGIQHCIACNQGCFDQVFQLQPVTCLVNPRAGEERKYPITKAGERKKIMVIGGGPAGMMAALTAARRGHEVMLYEKNETLGGQIPLAAVPPGRQEMASLARDLAAQLDPYGVEVNLNQEVTPTLVQGIQPQVVILATGARPLRPPIPGVNRPQVVTAWEVLNGEAEVGSPVVVIGGGAVGCETALFLSRIGALDPQTLMFLFEEQAESPETLLSLVHKGNKEVILMEMLTKLGRDIGASTRWSILQDIQRRGIITHLATQALEITPESVVAKKGEENLVIPAKSVVLACGVEPVNSLYEELKGQVPEIHLIGDAKSPRKALEAVREGFLLGLEL